MAPVTSVDLPLLDEWGHERGLLTIATLPSRRLERTITVASNEDDADDDLENVRLVEGTEYVYILNVPDAAGPFDTDHSEMFVADTERGDRGRLRTGLHTGAVEVRFFAASQVVGKICFEVQSTKLSYVTDYHWMLRDIADVCADLVMDRFAPSAARFSVNDTRNVETLYQRFAFLRSVLESDEFRAAIGQILTSPHVTWENVEDVTWHGRGVRPSSHISRSLVRPGPRSSIAQLLVGDLDSIPRPMVVIRAAASVDNVPNRFVKWLIGEWLTLVGEVSGALSRRDNETARVRRGMREISRLTKTLEAILEDDLFRDVGELTVFPEANQVLQKREGYRQLFRAFLQLDTAARLYWPGLDPVYRAGQRNVAKLYEYWVYLQVGRIVARMSGQSFDATRLIERSDDGLTLRLHSREETMVAGNVQRFGRTIRVELWFNKSFGTSFAGIEGSWTRPLRPDCSLRVEVMTNEAPPLVTWIHFDAKYRIERLDETFGGDEDGDSVEPSGFRREDLLKMHAYKDAIRKSAGAYIIYPGTDEGKPFRQYHELLPGLGAFALRPTKDGASLGSDTLAVFIEHVMTHLSLQATQHARARYWTEQAYSGTPVETVLPAAPFLDGPPADVLVLLGYAKNAAHRAWIRHTRMYNLRADAFRGGAVGMSSRELSARILVVFGDDTGDIDMYKIVDSPRIMTDRQLQSMGYPEPRGNQYFCFLLEKLPGNRTLDWLTRGRIIDVRARKNPWALEGAPVVVTWLDLCAETQSSSMNDR
jgi:predicted component of viral defense system (DUF524 family)